MLNHTLPASGVLPLHCSAARAASGSTHLFLGLSGTGKTTLSSGNDLLCIGDDEHAWTAEGIANIEHGCYAKLARLSPQNEPAIHAAVFTPRAVRENGVIIENAFVLPDGSIDLYDLRLTENSRAAYPQSYLPGAVSPATGDHPETITFLTCDATGVLPPVALLSHEQALQWYVLGYTSKMSGTEVGVVAPKSTFSRLFGAPFMTRPTAEYVRLFSEKLRLHAPNVYLINTGWSGGPYGIGSRMPIAVSRAIVSAALSGVLAQAPCSIDEHFAFRIPSACPGVEPSLLSPKQTWSDPAAYDLAARTLLDSMRKALSTQKNLPGELLSI